MTEALAIRQAGPADITAVWSIEQASFASPWTRFAFLSELVNYLSTFLVAGPPPPEPWEIWGYVVFWVVADEMHILNLAVHSRQRRRGIARRLLTEAMARARKAGAATAWLEVRPSNASARALYTSLGFRQVGVRPRYYADTQEDALILAHVLKEDGGHL